MSNKVLQDALAEIDLEVKKGNFARTSTPVSDIIAYGAGDLKKENNIE